MPTISVVADESLQMADIVRVSITAERVWQVVLSLTVHDWTSLKMKSEAARRRWGAEMLYDYRDMLCMCRHHNA